MSIGFDSEPNSTEEVVISKKSLEEGENFLSRIFVSEENAFKAREIPSTKNLIPL